ncbi:aspartate aminotransferase family protein [Oceanibacterium hippocampi]|uniref:Taurine--pyruvate aminotransferase n=1 Tax=Oceanibacterium hippocampi TaxID=745714 RepID=A0A1Y5RFG2_9PROT|nr:aspartate aminotransferase family protein [Oceanibacterium hippocampi]SLN16388.1 Taurine--pyruvate aminotransferase [Oceanibacterium hippocampi]
MSISNKHRPTTAELRALDAAHHLHPFTDHAALGAKGVRVIDRAEGVYLWDSEGKRLLDGMAGLWCVNVGYGRERLAQVAFETMRDLPYYNTFFQTTHAPAVELAAKIREVTPEGMELVFFACSGSEANDSMVKFVRYFWNLQGRPEKKIMISRNSGYHGVTLAAASLSGLTPMHPQFDLPLPGFEKVDAPYWFRDGGDLSPEEFGLKAAASLETKILELGAGNVAAFVAEPIQGAGGVIIPPATYWPEIQRICDKHDVLLVADEVICGFGRTGNWFGCDTFGIRPDIMTMAKGMSSGYQPISAVVLGGRVAAAIGGADEELSHGFTYSGHPVTAAVALENIRIIEEEDLVTRVREDIGPYLQQGLQSLADHPLIGEVRGIGLLGALELVADKATRSRFPADRSVGMICRDHCFGNGLVMRAVGDTMVVSPPLTISREEVDELVRLARTAFDLTARDLGVSA